ncbi:protein LHY-like [Camellia sinensis]|uniref:protein LHY-like n=1 Tax=Camellia sinensis TaxID=4442 RepID=UPI001035D9A9|nr:protein LHY-like [Camellia sinensis]
MAVTMLVVTMLVARLQRKSTSLHCSCALYSSLLLIFHLQGRLAFRALFSRKVLPQSFSPPQDNKQNADEKAEDASRFDLNSMMWGTCPSHQVVQNNTFLRSENHGEGLLTIELGHGKLKPHRTGFKPYKRCSVEAKQSKVVSAASSQGEEQCPKRIRLEGEAST